MGTGFTEDEGGTWGVLQVRHWMRVWQEATKCGMF